jgi:hypothetical protein
VSEAARPMKKIFVNENKTRKKEHRHIFCSIAERPFLLK